MLPEIHKVLGLLEGGFHQVKVLVVGDLMLDRYILGEVDRISPEAPVPVLRHAHRYERPGGAANVAMNLAGLGCQAFLAGFWGEDAEKRELAALLDAADIDTAGVVTSTLPTISKTRIVGRRQQLLRLDIESLEAHSTQDLESLQARVLALVSKVHAIILSDYAKGALTNELCASVIAAARRANVPIFADPKTPDFSKYTGATMVCPNLHELSAATGIAIHELDALLAAGELQRQEHDLQYLTATMSERGIRVLSATGSFHSPARAREVFDVSGAGDTVIATIAAAMAAGLKVETAVDLANLAAGIVVGKVGTVPIAHHELITALTPSTKLNADEKLLDRESLAARIADWRAAGETIVFTNGCFDLLHVGHVTLLEECRRFGSKLVLGLNSDASVCRLKGPTRPVVGERERARVMAALAAVDAVVLFDEDTPLELIRVLKPDVLVKGGDYTVDTVVGHEEVLAGGGRVEIVATVEGFSTTNLVQKLSAQQNSTTDPESSS
ncbi:MAG TPA: bifunctional D-glycero-beta-D-manno-heptose-7-phosphate kinase/D-glycero-beta-D-manno-heptose 1-phosphate adenylyltransferase HldE [Acidobacteriaceae bacterium]